MENQGEIKAGHGGSRQGAGRKRLDLNERWFAARGIKPLHAAEILSHVADERALWQRVLSSEDDNVVLRALQFLVSMRDGKPAQQINVTSMTVSYTADEIARARAVVRELLPSPPLLHEGKANAATQHNAVEGQGVETVG